MIFSRDSKLRPRIARLKKRIKGLERKLAKVRRMENIIETAASRTPEIGTVIDVGAAKGWFSGLAQDTYPDSHLLLFEPQQFTRD